MISNGGEVVVEFQAFRGVHNEFILKEIAAVDVSTGRFVVVLFAPPCERVRLHPKIQKTNDWLMKHYHRIHWNDGTVPYKDMVSILTQMFSNFTVVYTKGLEKANFLRQYYNHGAVIDLNDIKAPIVPRPFIVQCPVPHQPNNTPHFHCALRKALFYANWLQQRSVCTV